MLEYLWSNPVRGLAIGASLLALAFTPIAFVILGRRDYLFARRGRVYRKPEWWSVVSSMLLIMGIPAILLALLVKSEYFDRDRYEFDPNRQFSVLDQGRQFRSVADAGAAVQAELRRLEGARDRLQARVAAVDRASGKLAGLAEQSPELAEQIGPVVADLRKLRDAAALDAFDPAELLSRLETTRKQLDAANDLEAVRATDDAVRAEMTMLDDAKSKLVDQIKAVDEKLVPLRAASAQAPTLATALNPILDAMADVRRQIGLDAPQQLMIEDTAPVDVRTLLAALGPVAGTSTVVVSPGATPAAAPAAPVGPGLDPSVREAELAAVAPAQRPLAELLPLTNIPEGWEVAKSGENHIETFNADNLYEKIDGRAESFLQYDVKGMSYTFYHPSGDRSAEVQLYIFDMSSPLKAMGKYGSEKPDESIAEKLGAEGYSSGASLFFHAKKYYVQLVATSDDDRFKQFALAIARRISNEILPGSAPDPSAEPVASAAEQPIPSTEPEVAPDALFALLPAGSGKANPKYVAQDVFGYAFLSDVFMADYSAGDATWQAFIRTYPNSEAAAKVFQQYRDEAAAFGAQLKEEAVESADAAFRADNFGQVDLIFLKGNAVGGVNGATKPEPVQAFLTEFAKALPAVSPSLPADEPDSPPTAP